MKVDVKKFFNFAVKVGPVVYPMIKKFLDKKKNNPTTRR